jgi:hypothetical protein
MYIKYLRRQVCRRYLLTSDYCVACCFIVPASKNRYPVDFGFRDGDQGTHTSRTIMLAELRALLAVIPENARRDEYLAAAIEDNVLGKSTVATRKLSIQRLSELYALDPSVPLFRVLRHLWAKGIADNPLLALLCSVARDPLLRATVSPILELSPGEELSRQRMTDSIRATTGARLNESTLDKVVRNASSSWVQGGHLQGRARKFRQSVRSGAVAATYALVLGYLQGVRGSSLFRTIWTDILCLTPDELRGVAMDAKRLGYLDLKIAGDIIEVGFPSLLTRKEIEQSRVTH